MTLSIWITCAILNVIIISIRQAQEPVDKNAFISATVRNALLGPISTVGILLSVGGFFHRKA